MEGVAFTDLHTHNYTSNRYTSQNTDSRLENCLLVIDDVYALCKKRHSKIIFFSGDIVDQQQAVPTVTGIALVARLKTRIEENPEIIWYVITGNHDQGSKNVWGSKCTTSYMEYLSILFPDNIKLVDNTFALCSEEEYCYVHGIPYYQHPEHYRKALEERAADVKGIKHSASDSVHILMIHQTPSGLPNPNIPIDTDIHDPLYECFDLIMCGHIHQKAELSQKFFLLGSPLHRDLGDEGDEKGIYLLDCAEPAETITFVSRKGKYPEFKRVKGVISAADAGNFVVQEVEITINVKEAHNIENFKSSLTETELLTNYWKEVDGKDEELLKTGLEFINH